ncbi:MAG: DNA translocase FtsK [Acidimicrobiaceae bacterium]|nr:DNA translocase FtsK [Acidimicrobiaceae bacterium]
MSQKVTNSARSGATSGSRNRKTTSSRSSSGARKPSPTRAAQQRSVLDHIRSMDDSFRGMVYAGVAILLLVSLLTPFFGPLGKDVMILVESIFGFGSFVALISLFLCGLMLMFPEHVAFAKHRGIFGSLSALSLAGIQGDLYQSFSGPQIRAKGGVLGYLIGHSLSLAASRFGGLLILALLFVLFTLAFFNVGPERAAVIVVDKLKSFISADEKRDVDQIESLSRSWRGPRRLRTRIEKDLEDEADNAPIAGINLDKADPVLSGMVDQSSIVSGGSASKSSKVRNINSDAIELSVEKVAGLWRLPSLSLLKRGTIKNLDKEDLASRGRVLQGSLATHGVVTRLVGMTVGPTVTRYELELGEGVKVSKVTSLNKDIAYAMAAADVRILAPIPGRSAIGVEVPNQNRQVVTLGDVLSSEEASLARHPLEVALGRDIAGRAVMVNLAEMPHVLIAGATGAGKSSCINSIITSVLMRATPDEVRMILVDPKRVELGQYNGLPHLLTQVVTNPKKAANALSWAVKEMERRYDLLSEVGVRDITGYNQMVASLPSDIGKNDSLPRTLVDEILDDSPLFNDVNSQSLEHLPFIIVVVDELNDLMMVAARDVEESICRIAQMARAVGIHLLIATQRPSVDVITGVIKANVPSRMAFSVSSLADSRVILDQPGAERLVGKGDMLLLNASSNVPRRIQAPWVSEAEVRAVVGHWLRSSKPQYVDGVEGSDDRGEFGFDSDDSDALMDHAIELVVSSQLGSTSMLQRKLRVGFARAGRLMDLLEARGIVGPSEGSKPRVVLMSREELENHKEEGYF